MSKKGLEFFISSKDIAEKTIKQVKKGGIILKEGRDELVFAGSKEEIAATWAYNSLCESESEYLSQKIVDQLQKLDAEFDIIEAVFIAVKLYNINYFRMARKELKLNQDEMSVLLGWSKQQVCNVESGYRELQIQTKLAVEALLRRAGLWESFNEKVKVVNDKKI